MPALAICAMVLPAIGQPLLADSDMEELRQRAPAGDNDTNTIRQWLAAEFAAIDAAHPDDFRKKIQKLRTDPATNPAFRSEFDTRLAEFAADQLGKDNPEHAAIALIRTLIDLNDPLTIPGLEAGLSSAHPTVRYLAARGLADLGPRIASDPNKLAPFILALQQAGVAETNGVIVERIYRALDLKPLPPQAVTAFEQILSARIAQYRERRTRLLDQAEITAVQILTEAGLDQARSAGIVRALAPLLRLDVQQLTSMLDNPKLPQPIGARDLLERRL